MYIFKRKCSPSDHMRQSPSPLPTLLSLPWFCPLKAAPPSTPAATDAVCISAERILLPPCLKKDNVRNVLNILSSSFQIGDGSPSPSHHAVFPFLASIISFPTPSSRGGLPVSFDYPNCPVGLWDPRWVKSSRIKALQRGCAVLSRHTERPASSAAPAGRGHAAGWGRGGAQLLAVLRGCGRTAPLLTETATGTAENLGDKDGALPIKITIL